MSKVHAIATDDLKKIVARIERLEDEKATLATDITEVYGEAKAKGYDVKILRKVIRMRKMDSSKLEEEQQLIEMYQEALGMLPQAA